MIQIYAPSNTDFSKNGTSLIPTSCKLSMQINGTWSVLIENALDDRFQNIVENAVLSVPTPYGQQLFRITQMDKSDTGVSATAVPIFLDAQNDTFIYDQRPTDKTGQQALDILMDGTKYTGHSDITTLNTAYYQMKNLIECLASDDENSFLNRWGGEIRFDDYDIYINERLGADNGARVEFGFNLSSIQESIDMSSVVTKIVPIAYNGYTLPDGETVNSPNVNKYPIHYIRTIHYDDIKLAEDATEGEEDVTVCDTLDELYQALRTRAAAEYDSGIDIPSITYQVDMVDLAKTEEYAAFKDLVTVNLGDTVHVKHRRFYIETQARIVALEYDCIQKKVTSLTIGDSVQDYFDKTSSITSAAEQVIDTSTNTLMANRIAGVINLLNTSLRAQKGVAQRQDVRAILFEDLDESSPTYGALCIGTQGIQIAKERNAEGTDWKWGTAINFQSINADYIITGILTDRNGKFYFNLDTGELVMADGTFAGKINGSAINGGTIQGTTITGTTINGGTISGTTIKGGSINGSTLNTERSAYVGQSIYLSNNDANISTRQIRFNKTSSQYANITHAANSGSLFDSLAFRVQKSGSYSIINMFAGSTNEITFNIKDGSSSGTHTFADTGATIDGNLQVMGNINATGSKNRVVQTENYGKRLMNAVESADAFFEDFGTAMTDAEGFCEVRLDVIFLETVNTDYDYHVFLTPYSDDYAAKASIYSKSKDRFIVCGTPYTRFDWRVSAKQRGYEHTRMEVMEDDNTDQNRASFDA